MGINQPPKPPLPFKDFHLGGIKFDKKLLDNCIAAAKESGIENEDILKQTAFQIYYGQRQYKSTDRIRNNVVFWSWITAGWIIITLGGIGAVSSFF